MIFSKLALAMLALGAGSAVGGALAATQRFDGRWNVEAVTENGNCRPSYRFAAVVENGRVRYDGLISLGASGQIESDGRLNVNVERAGNGTSISGRLVGNAGQGRWTIAGARACGGRWNAERQG